MWRKDKKSAIQLVSSMLQPCWSLFRDVTNTVRAGDAASSPSNGFVG